MAYNLFVGGLPYETTQDELAKLFCACGNVTNVKLIMDRETGRSKGFGFVEMATEADMKAAILKLNGSALGQRQLFVSEAKPQEKRSDGPAAQPGFVERRSGVKDRRRQPEGGLSGARREGFGGEKKSWGDKPAWSGKPREGGFGGKKKWDAKPGLGGAKKKWDDRPAFSGERKPWEGKPGADGGKRKEFGDKKKWIPGGQGGSKKKWGPGGPGAGNKWGPKRKKFGGGFGGGKPGGRGK